MITLIVGAGESEKAKPKRKKVAKTIPTIRPKNKLTTLFLISTPSSKEIIKGARNTTSR